MVMFHFRRLVAFAQMQMQCCYFKIRKCTEYFFSNENRRTSPELRTDIRQQWLPRSFHLFRKPEQESRARQSEYAAVLLIYFN